MTQATSSGETRRGGGQGGGRSPGEPSLSASLLLIAPLPKAARDGHDYRVLLLKRAEKSSTYQSAHVFPGGNVDPVDRDTDAWSPFFPSLTPFTAGVPSSSLAPTSSPSILSDADMQTVKLCAIRETFEEAGVLLFEPSTSVGTARQREIEEKWRNVDDRTKTHLRERVHSSGKEFVDLFEKNLGKEVRPGVSKLTHWANWVTPLMLPRRFDTHFFISILPSPAASTGEMASSADAVDETPYYKLASSDGVETSIAEWLTPTQAIRRALAHTANLSYPSTVPTYAEQPHSMGNNPTKSIILHPPQFYLLAELAQNHKSYRSFLDHEQGGAAVRPRSVKSFTPQIGKVVDEGGKPRPATLLPGDEDFVDSAGGGRGKVGVRHRTYVIPPNERTQGLTVLGVHRRGLEDGPGWEDMSGGDIGEKGAKL
ncbi:hypothetical protein JCM11491_000672 [Sporobolomyces phaffii]